MNFPPNLNRYVEYDVISRNDISAAALLVKMAGRNGTPESQLLAWLGICLALRTVRDGHTCVDLDRIASWAGKIDLEAENHCDWPTEAGPWRDSLRAADVLVGQPGDRKPFILDGSRLYLARSFAEENSIAAAIRVRAKAGTIRILLGGPGTGKTTKVAGDLLSRFNNEPRDGIQGDVALAAPTGKAAARMAEALRLACENNEQEAFNEARERILQLKPTTVHKLLGNNPNRGNYFEYRKDNRLPYRHVIVDEASMLSSSLMYHLLEALSDDATLMLVGDPDQLASVDAGTALGDIALFGGDEHEDTPLHDCIETLTTCHRIESREILELAKAIRDERVEDARNILVQEGNQVVWVDPANSDALSDLTERVVRHATELREAARDSDPGALLDKQRQLQVICGHREGPMSVAFWNAKIEKGMNLRSGFIWYTGRPVMVTRNSPSLQLANGDVGVVLKVGDVRKAVFGSLNAEGNPIQMPVSRLEDIDTVHALTIHKSQGSEYGHAVVVLPERVSRIVTRELLYTAVTRARRQVTVVGPWEVVEAAIRTPIRRATGLASRLAKGNPID